MLLVVQVVLLLGIGVLAALLQKRFFGASSDVDLHGWGPVIGREGHHC